MAIKVTCEVQTYDIPAKLSIRAHSSWYDDKQVEIDIPAKLSIRVHSSWYDDKQVEIEVEGKRYTVMGKDLITAIEDAMCVNRWG